MADRNIQKDRVLQALKDNTDKNEDGILKQYCGDDVVFGSVKSAQAFIDSLPD